MNKGYKHYWVLDQSRDWYLCNVCKTAISKNALFDTILEEERVHDCLDRLSQDVVCREAKEQE